MFFRRIYDEGLAQASYLIGCQQKGTAVVVDPRRDVQVYLDVAAQQGLRIVAVTETHIHADYLSGSLELAARTDATLYLSDEGGSAWAYAFPHEGLRHGSEIRLGKVILRALHTPGHTPEHLSFLVSDGARTAEPVLLLTGDFVFVGDLGRPDLLDEAAGGEDTRFEGAQQLFRSLQDTFLTFAKMRTFGSDSFGRSGDGSPRIGPESLRRFLRRKSLLAQHGDVADIQNDHHLGRPAA